MPEPVRQLDVETLGRRILELVDQLGERSFSFARPAGDRSRLLGILLAQNNRARIQAEEGAAVGL